MMWNTILTSIESHFNTDSDLLGVNIAQGHERTFNNTICPAIRLLRLSEGKDDLSANNQEGKPSEVKFVLWCFESYNQKSTTPSDGYIKLSELEDLVRASLSAWTSKTHADDLTGYLTHTTITESYMDEFRYNLTVGSFFYVTVIARKKL